MVRGAASGEEGEKTRAGSPCYGDGEELGDCEDLVWGAGEEAVAGEEAWAAAGGEAGEGGEDEAVWAQDEGGEFGEAQGRAAGEGDGGVFVSGDGEEVGGGREGRDVLEGEACFGVEVVVDVEAPDVGDAVDLGIVVAADEEPGDGVGVAEVGDGVEEGRGEPQGGVEEVPDDEEALGGGVAEGAREAGEVLVEESAGEVGADADGAGGGERVDLAEVEVGDDEGGGVGPVGGAVRGQVELLRPRGLRATRGRALRAGEEDDASSSHWDLIFFRRSSSVSPERREDMRSTTSG